MKKNPLLQLIVGLAMLCGGGYWFLSSIRVTTGFYGFFLWGMSVSGGLVVVPFICGIVWLFLNSKSIGAKLLTGIGLLLIVASVIASTNFIFTNTTLFVYLVMLVLMFGGAALVIQVMVGGHGKSEDS